MHMFQFFFQVLKSSDVNKGQSEVSHLTSHLSEQIFIVILLSLAFIKYATCQIQVIFNISIFEVSKWRSQT